MIFEKNSVYLLRYDDTSSMWSMEYDRCYSRSSYYLLQEARRLDMSALNNMMLQQQTFTPVTRWLIAPGDGYFNRTLLMDSPHLTMLKVCDQAD